MRPTKHDAHGISYANNEVLNQTVGPENEPSKKDVETFIREIAPLQEDQHA